jgi:enoyl-CoA hydratase
MGGGLELALSCDLCIVRDGPFDLGLPEINIGLLPGGGGTQRLTRIVGRARALELMLWGKTFSPREAVVLGLASECVAGPILPRALQVASELAAKSPQAIAHIKRLVREFSSGDMRLGLAAERTLFCDLMVSRAAIEAMHAMNSGAIDIICRATERQ